MKNEKMLMIPKIESGMVIDHIPAGDGIKILNVLRASPGMSEVATTVGLNYVSPRLGHKDMIKLVVDELPKDVLDRLSLVNPGITIKRIRDYAVDERLVLGNPEEIVGQVRCGNPNCITNHERGLTAHFKATRRNPERYRCLFCERVFGLAELEHP